MKEPIQVIVYFGGDPEWGKVFRYVLYFFAGWFLLLLVASPFLWIACAGERNRSRQEPAPKREKLVTNEPPPVPKLPNRYPLSAP